MRAWKSSITFNMHLEIMREQLQRDEQAYDAVFPFKVRINDRYRSNNLSEIDKWCLDFCRDIYLCSPVSLIPSQINFLRITHRTVWFTSNRDATYFKLRWQ